MKLGTIRRIDDLGRIVIPKDVRTSLRIKSGDNLEIYVEEENIILKKYSELNKIKDVGQTIVNLLKETLKSQIIITDKDKIIIDSEEKYINQKINENISKILENRQMIIKENVGITQEENETGNIIINPIIVNGDIYGSILLITPNQITEEIINTITLMTNFLIKYVE